MDQILGVDVGGTGLKGAIVDIHAGTLLSEKIKFKTPSPSTPQAVIDVIRQLVSIYNWEGKPFGLCFPSVIQDGIARTASNIDKSWLGFHIDEALRAAFGVSVLTLNDADSAGIAEMTFGTGKGEMGKVIMLTLGTGIGSGLFYDGRLIPNTEFGHLNYKKSVWEHYASNKARLTKELSWEKWGKLLNAYLNHIEFLISPNLIILGGGVSKKFELYKPFLNLKARVVTAKMLNNAGIIGAAYQASKKKKAIRG